VSDKQADLIARIERFEIDCGSGVASAFDVFAVILGAILRAGAGTTAASPADVGRFGGKR
jgi:hypothetical protein